MNVIPVRPEVHGLVALGQLPASDADDATWNLWWHRLEAAFELEWSAAEEIELLRIIPKRLGNDSNAWIFVLIGKLEASPRRPRSMLRAIPEDTDTDWLNTIRWLASQASTP